MLNTSHIDVEDYIDGDAFENLNLPDTTYVKTDDVKSRLDNSKISRVLITHNSDLAVTEELAKKAFRPGGSVADWFGQNVLINHPRVHPVPIGLERVRWFPSLRKRSIIREFSLRSYRCQEPPLLCLANFSVNTNPTERAACLKAALPFATVKVANTVDQSGPNTYVKFMEDVARHKFVLCPNGNGIDTHRLWETLYSGRIPVVTRSLGVSAWSSLPMVVLDSWCDLTPEVLDSYWYKFRCGLLTFSIDLLKFGYWAECIAKAARGKVL